MRLWRLVMTIKREKPPPLRRGFGGGFCEFWLKFRGKFTPHAVIASLDEVKAWRLREAPTRASANPQLAYC